MTPLYIAKSGKGALSLRSYITALSHLSWLQFRQCISIKSVNAPFVLEFWSIFRFHVHLNRYLMDHIRKRFGLTLWHTIHDTRQTQHGVKCSRVGDHGHISNCGLCYHTKPGPWLPPTGLADTCATFRTRDLNSF